MSRSQELKSKSEGICQVYSLTARHIHWRSPCMS